MFFLWDDKLENDLQSRINNLLQIFMVSKCGFLYILQAPHKFVYDANDQR